MNKSNKNIFGEKLLPCSFKPLTGYFRNGCCETNIDDTGLHTVCVIVDEKFLNFSKMVGNDLTTPIKKYSFPGLRSGDRWCLCALRWKEALFNNVAPKVVLESTNEKALEIININDLIKYAYKTKK